MSESISGLKSSHNSAMMSAVYFLLLVLPLLSAQTFHWGPCPTPCVQPNFKLEKYLGKWYEIEKVPSCFSRGKCSEANYSLRKDGTIKVVNSKVVKDKLRSVEGTGVVRNAAEPAKLGVSFSYFNPYSPYWVLSTDYTSVAIVYSCTDFLNLFHFQYAWILGRSRFLPSWTMKHARKLLEKEGIDVSRMQATDQNCKDKKKKTAD